MKTQLLISLIVMTIGFPAFAEDKCMGLKAVNADDVVGTYGKTSIKLTELDARIAKEKCKAKLEYDKKINELRQEALDELLDTKVLEQEASALKKADVTTLLRDQVSAKLTSPTDAAMKAEYDKAKDQLQGISYEEVKPQIEQFLTQKALAVATQAYIKKLRTKYEVTTQLPVFRVDVKTSGPSKGAKDAKVVILEFADFECPYCERGNSTLNELIKRYPKDVRVVYKDFPLDFHENAVPAAIACRCAGEQGKYWEMHSLLFANYAQLNVDKIAELAKGLSLDNETFGQCLNNPKHAEAIAADQAEGARYGVEGTPAFFVNGIPLSGAQPLETFVEIVERELKRLK